MLKKVASISLTILVNMLLLTVSVVSHHHHNGFPHFGYEYLEHKHAEEATAPCYPNEKNEICAFEQEIIIFNDPKENSFSASNSLHNHSNEFVQALFYLPDYPLPAVLEEQLPKPPCLIHYYSAVVNSGMGLRAPPIA